eukprot:CAMPEP_0118955956 /NCGR_PEP_ID=MMETSP1169-20130426/60798_1 /TAXON_ID=36882 /ORGANISM="Pyramimonas obovata, Strain CCMP722" /LENGTH=189 /DNA_ID=CAMNT_0006903891 /DNA_START=224 /DNA_END=793 /DNA_ORIENTATION=+
MATRGTKRRAAEPKGKQELIGSVVSPDKICKEEGCSKPVDGGNPYCRAHGGGRKCQHEGCKRYAELNVGASYKDVYCKAHGEERRRQQGSKAKQKAKVQIANLQPGERKCQHGNCTKFAANGGTLFCLAHGGGHRCQHEGCDGPAISHGTPFCKSHAARHTCMAHGCTNIPEGYAINCAYHGGMGGLPV